MPRPARFATHEVVLVDLSTIGAGIRHQSKIGLGTSGVLRFRLERQYHEIECTLSRSKLEIVKAGSKTLQIYRSGIRFASLDGAANSIRDAIRTRVDRAIARQRADALGDPTLLKGITESSGSVPVALLAQWMETRLFIRCTLDKHGTWHREQVNDPDQPESGFTVSVEETQSDVLLLCKTYEKATAEQRKLIRLFARVSIDDPSDEPRGQYRP
jgi:hypothetical protein